MDKFYFTMNAILLSDIPVTVILLYCLQTSNIHFGFSEHSQLNYSWQRKLFYEVKWNASTEHKPIWKEIISNSHMHMKTVSVKIL